jgi:hypothetical protein
MPDEQSALHRHQLRRVLLELFRRLLDRFALA